MFDDYDLVSHNLNEVFIRSNNRCQNASEDTDDEDDDIIDFIPPNTIFAIAAGSGHEILWFVNFDSVNTACDLVSDKQSHLILPGQVYITGRYLEKKRELKNEIFFKIINHQVFIAKESVMYPFANFQFAYKGKPGELFLRNLDYIEMLNFVEHSNMAML